MSIDLTAIQKPQTPITIVATGLITGFFEFHDTFESAIGNELANQGVPADSLAVSWSSPLGANFSIVVICRTTSVLVTAASVVAQVSAAVVNASGNPTSSITVTKIGNAGDVITPQGPAQSLIDRILAALADVGTVLKWAAIAIVVGIVIYLAVETGAVTAARKAFA